MNSNHHIQKPPKKLHVLLVQWKHRNWDGYQEITSLLLSLVSCDWLIEPQVTRGV